MDQLSSPVEEIYQSQNQISIIGCDLTGSLGGFIHLVGWASRSILIGSNIWEILIFAVCWKDNPRKRPFQLDP